MDATRGDPSKKQNLPVNSDTVEFAHVFAAELQALQERRDAARQSGPGVPPDEHRAPTPAQKDKKDAGDSVLGALPASDDFASFASGTAVLNAIGLALSGGGIRSASFCLGVLQALDRAGVVRRLDYLSTVSGGGYIGASLSAAMTKSQGAFPFESIRDQADTQETKHIRNYANYLMPHGKTDVLESVVIYLRGIVANIILVLPWLILAAYITVRSNPTRAHLDRPDIFRIPVFNIFPFNHFVLTAYSALIFLFLFAVWALWRSNSFQLGKPDVPNILTKFYGWAVAFVFVVASFELQPFAFTMIWNGSDWTYNVTSWLQRASLALAPLAGLAALFRGQLQALIQRATEAPDKSTRITGWLGRILTYMAAAAVPLLLWAVYLQLSWWGIADCAKGPCQFPDAPRWLVTAAERLFGGGPEALIMSRPYPMATFYIFCFLILVSLSMFLEPNANSLHRLYRDRLSKAFLFEPGTAGTRDDPKPLDRFKLSDLNSPYAPYHLVNTALNIQGSKFVNKRGRNADFFLFSRHHVGSEATRYVSTRAMEKAVPALDLGTAMAISAAAASSNMGARSIRALTPTLALLNIRVGFWLRNPGRVKTSGWKARLWNFFNLYFLYELMANLDEKSWDVYVTDGGHVENLGVYELLRRRCRVIIVVDAEADLNMKFGSLVTLQRYARIDLGVHIKLPWGAIQDTTLRTSRAFAENGKAERARGPHCAVGEIEYPNGGKGLIIYIKSSITGDENDYILNYKTRYPLFPHESTGDQFFSEEQFEVYRALGFHAAHGLFNAPTGFAGLDPAVCDCASEELAWLDRLFGLNQ